MCLAFLVFIIIIIIIFPSVYKGRLNLIEVINKFIEKNIVRYFFLLIEPSRVIDGTFMKGIVLDLLECCFILYFFLNDVYFAKKITFTK